MFYVASGRHLLGDNTEPHQHSTSVLTCGTPPGNSVLTVTCPVVDRSQLKSCLVLSCLILSQDERITAQLISAFVFATRIV